jgi:putative membrane protein
VTAQPTLIENSPALELASNQTTLGFERTMMSGNRTLMSIVRTSLAMIGFGFTIYTVFQKLYEQKIVRLNPQSARNFGLALVLMGVVFLVMGIWANLHFQHETKAHYARLQRLKMVRGTLHQSATPTLAIAGALLLLGMAVFAVIMSNSLE